MKSKLLLIFLVFIANTGLSQIKVITDPDVFKVHRNEEIVDIKIINNTILVPLDLGKGLQVYFILDTGVSNPIITDPIIVPLLGLEYVRDMELRGYGRDEPLQAIVADGFSYSVGGRTETFKEQVIVLDEAIPFEELLGEPVYGIIGHSFFNHYYTKIYFNNSLLRVYDKSDKNRKLPKRYKKFDVEIIGDKPFLKAEIENNGQTDTLKLLIDTGFSGAVSLYPHRSDLLGEDQPKLENYLGLGLNGVVTSTFFKSDELRLNDFTFHSIATNLIDTLSLANTSIQNYSDGSIGVEILRRFHVVFDYDNLAIYLRRKSDFRDPFFYNASGLRVVKALDKEKNEKYLITSIREGSNADLSGLQTEDEIIEIDGRPVKSWSIRKIYEKINDFTEPDRHIVVKRNNEELTFDFQINNSIPWN